MYTAENWPIACKMNFGAKTDDGTPINEASVSVWADQIEQVIALGFKSIDPIDDWINISTLSEARFKEFTQLINSYNLIIPGISFGRRSPVDLKLGEEYVKRMHVALDRGAELGAKILNIGFMQDLTPAQEKAQWFWHAPGHKDDPELRQLAIERVRDVANHASANGMEISLEMYEDTYLGTAEDAVSFVKDCDHSAVGINPDIGNLIRLHRPIPDYQQMFDLVLPYANYWHIKNYLRDEDPETGAYFSAPAPLESGWIDYRSIVRQALSLGYKGAFQTEQYGGDWLGVGATNARYIRNVLRGAEKLISK